MSPDSANFYKAISELQTVLVGLVEDARQESREDHLALLKRLDAQDDRLRHLERKQEPTPWPPMKAPLVIPDGDEKPVFRVTFADFKRWGIAFAAFAGLVTTVNLAAEFVLKVIHWFGFHR